MSDLTIVSWCPGDVCDPCLQWQPWCYAPKDSATATWMGGLPDSEPMPLQGVGHHYDPVTHWIGSDWIIQPIKNINVSIVWTYFNIWSDPMGRGDWTSGSGYFYTPEGIIVPESGSSVPILFLSPGDLAPWGYDGERTTGLSIIRYGLSIFKPLTYVNDYGNRLDLSAGTVHFGFYKP